MKILTGIPLDVGMINSNAILPRAGDGGFGYDTMIGIKRIRIHPDHLLIFHGVGVPVENVNVHSLRRLDLQPHLLAVFKHPPDLDRQIKVRVGLTAAAIDIGL